MGVVNGMLKTIKVKDVRLGMYIHELKGPWMDHPFWRSKFVLKDPEDLQKLLASRIQEVVIDVSQGLDVAKAKKTLSEPPPQPALSDKELVMLELDGPAPSPPPASPDPNRHTPTTIEAEREQAVKIIAS